MRYYAIQMEEVKGDTFTFSTEDIDLEDSDVAMVCPHHSFWEIYSRKSRPESEDGLSRADIVNEFLEGIKTKFGPRFVGSVTDTEGDSHPTFIINEEFRRLAWSRILTDFTSTVAKIIQTGVMASQLSVEERKASPNLPTSLWVMDQALNGFGNVFSVAGFLCNDNPTGEDSWLLEPASTVLGDWLHATRDIVLVPSSVLAMKW